MPDCPRRSIPPAGSRFSFINRVQSPPISTVERCQHLARCQKEHTYIFVVNGLDPLCFANLNGCCHSIRSLGFENVYFGQFWQPPEVERKIANIRRTDPQAKIVLMGYSTGANDARRLCHSLKKEDISIDLLIYLGGDRIFNVPESRPANAHRILNITGHGFFFLGGDLFVNGDEISGAKNIRLDELHLRLPSRASALDPILTELAEVAGCVPVSAP